jgi:glycerol-3-phosphate dehydrogenase (NAD(P)+)
LKICLLGSGSWGTALAIHLHNVKHQVHLWAFDPNQAQELITTRRNSLIPEAVIPSEILVTNSITEALKEVEGVVFAVPSSAIRSSAQTASSHWPHKAWAVCVSKGLEPKTHLRLSEVLSQTLPPQTPLAVLSGPSHAEEVVGKLPTTVVAASANSDLAKTVQDVFHSDFFRVYTSSDLLGVELGASLKNVIAIAAGISDGLGLGDNTKAALMTRGLSEMSRLGVALGAKPQTFAGLTGMGDLTVTCISRHSRNRLLGEKIGQGKNLQQALAEMTMVAEGMFTAKAALDLAEIAGVEIPITQEVYNVLFNHKTPKEAIKSLLARSAKPEND